ncbi:hypothetical protein ACJMK2_038807 [Sinanodonta woodiana]|uniref:Uncharacterized protein n=1 Tax=Sinanodonta woodiana TaxID=1069815 RepID=A0ABD3WA50_SINWO
MAQTLFRLIWLLSIGSTVKSIDIGVVFALFSWMGGQHTQNNNIVIGEYNQTWTSCDTNKVRGAMEELQAENNSYLECIFGNHNFSYQSPFESQFKQIENSRDDFVSLPEFESYYDVLVLFWIR